MNGPGRQTWMHLPHMVLPQQFTMRRPGILPGACGGDADRSAAQVQHDSMSGSVYASYMCLYRRRVQQVESGACGSKCCPSRLEPSMLGAGASNHVMERSWARWPEAVLLTGCYSYIRVQSRYIVYEYNAPSKQHQHVPCGLPRSTTLCVGISPRGPLMLIL